MTSLITNTAASVALQNLRSTDRALDASARRISTGLRIGAASDGAAYWAIASSLRGDNLALDALHDSIGLQRGALDVTARRVDMVIDQLGRIGATLVTAASGQADRSKLQEAIRGALASIQSVADAAPPFGGNWLSADTGSPGYAPTAALPLGLARRDGASPVITYPFDTSGLLLFDGRPRESEWSYFSPTPAAGSLGATLADIASTASLPQPEGYQISTWDGETWRGGSTLYLTWNYGLLDTRFYVADGNQGMAAFSIASIDLTSVGTDRKMVAAFARVVDATREKLLDAATRLGATSTMLTSQQGVTRRLMDGNASAIGTLVDADVEEEAVKLKALQVQRELGLQALGVANNAPQAILTLLRQ